MIMYHGSTLGWSCRTLLEAALGNDSTMTKPTNFVTRRRRACTGFVRNVDDALLRVRRTTVEPWFGQTKHVRGITTFARRGLTAAQQEWQLIAATANLLKLHRSHPAPA